MGEDDQSQEETDFKTKGKQGSGISFSPAIWDLQDKKGSTVASMFNREKEHIEGDRRGSSAESPSMGTSGARGVQRKNSETIFNLEY